jgi:SAM-dependent methyltransferase
LDADSYVVEIASNDGYLLQNFVQRGIPCLGIDPARNVAKVAQERGIPTLVEFFGGDLADRLGREGRRPNLLIGNNVLAQVPDLNDFVDGVAKFLAPEGVAVFEFPHVLRLLEQTQFDTIYHEHFSYFSLLSARSVFSRHELVVFDVDEIPTHGGSLRIYVRHAADRSKAISEAVPELVYREEREGLGRREYYESFAADVEAVKRNLLRFLIDAREEGKSAVGYGAPGKGNTLLNYCGIRTDLLSYTVDRNPRKQGMFLPGTHIPIYHPDRIKETKPDYVLILPWNLMEEISDQMRHIRDWGGEFVVPIPELRVF